MNEKPNRSIPDLIRDKDLIQNALTRAIQETIRVHKLLGHPIVIWRDGKVVWVPPEEIKLEEESTDSPKNGPAKGIKSDGDGNE